MASCAAFLDSPSYYSLGFFLQADSMLARKPSGAKPPVWWIPMLLLRMERIEVVAHIVAKGRANASDDDWRPSRARDAPRKFF